MSQLGRGPVSDEVRERLEKLEARRREEEPEPEYTFTVENDTDTAEQYIPRHVSGSITRTSFPKVPVRRQKELYQLAQKQDPWW